MFPCDACAMVRGGAGAVSRINCERDLEQRPQSRVRAGSNGRRPSLKRLWLLCGLAAGQQGQQHGKGHEALMAAHRGASIGAEHGSASPNRSSTASPKHGAILTSFSRSPQARSGLHACPTCLQAAQKTAVMAYHRSEQADGHGCPRRTDAIPAPRPPIILRGLGWKDAAYTVAACLFEEHA
jgi:hypothetical protein